MPKKTSKFYAKTIQKWSQNRRTVNESTNKFLKTERFSEKADCADTIWKSCSSFWWSPTGSPKIKKANWSTNLDQQSLQNSGLKKWWTKNMKKTLKIRPMELKMEAKSIKNPGPENYENLMRKKSIPPYPPGEVLRRLPSEDQGQKSLLGRLICLTPISRRHASPAKDEAQCRIYVAVQSECKPRAESPTRLGAIRPRYHKISVENPAAKFPKITKNQEKWIPCKGKSAYVNLQGPCRFGCWKLTFLILKVMLNGAEKYSQKWLGNEAKGTQKHRVEATFGTKMESKMEPRRIQNGAKGVQNGAKRVSKWSQKDPKMAAKSEPKWSQKASQNAIQKSHPEKGREKGAKKVCFLEPFWSKIHSKNVKQINAKIDAEKVSKIDAQMVQKWSQNRRTFNDFLNFFRKEILSKSHSYQGKTEVF